MAATGPDRDDLQAVGLEEPADRLRHLLVALLANDQPVVRVGPEGLVFGTEPLGKPLGGLSGT